VADGTHLIVTVEADGGLSAESPQLPGLVMGRPTETEFLRDYRKILKELGARMPIYGHRQWRHETYEGVEYIVRLSEDNKDLRISLSQRLSAVLGSEQRHDVVRRSVATVTGEILFICALPLDRIGFITEQLDLAAGDAAVLVAPVAEDGVWTTELIVGPNLAGKDWHSLSELGLTQDSTVSELMMASGIEGIDRGLVHSDQRLMLSA
jgi:hypothetical protein